MATVNDFPARGRISDIGNGQLTFRPTNTNYEIHVQIPANFTTPGDTLVDGAITVNARKVWTVPSGGNFVTPIFGPPKIIQGRVKYADQKQIVVQAGVPVIVNLPAEDSALDLSNGGIAVGTLVNVVALPGAKFEVLDVAAGQK